MHELSEKKRKVNLKKFLRKRYKDYLRIFVSTSLWGGVTVFFCRISHGIEKYLMAGFSLWLMSYLLVYNIRFLYDMKFRRARLRFHREQMKLPELQRISSRPKRMLFDGLLMSSVVCFFISSYFFLKNLGSDFKISLLVVSSFWVIISVVVFAYSCKKIRGIYKPSK